MMQFDATLLDEANLYAISNDRALYDPYFVAFEEYCSDHKVVYTMLSGAYCILKTHDLELRPKYDSYMVTVVSNNPYKTTVDVCNILVATVNKHINSRGVKYKRSGDDFVISINTRECFKVSAAPMYRDALVDNLVGTMPGKGLWTGRDVICQNIYSLLSYLLSQSYDPRGKLDVVLIRSIIDVIRPSIKTAVTGAKDKHREPDRVRILKYISSRDDVYVVDKGSVLPSYVLDAPFDVLRKELEGQFKIRVARYNLHDLDDFALHKFIIHDADDKAVCAFFNSLEHQVVPVRLCKGERCLSRRYAARIQFLEIQMLKMMSHIGKDMSTIIGGILRRVIQLVDDPKFFDEDDIIGYAGVCVNWIVLKRMLKKTFMQDVYALPTDPAFEVVVRKHGGQESKYVDATDIIDGGW